jgi:hypothetical protein
MLLDDLKLGNAACNMIKMMAANLNPGSDGPGSSALNRSSVG